MDFSKFKTSDWLKVGGGLLFFIAFFFNWYKADTEFVDFGYSGSDYFLTGVIPFILLVAVGVLAFLAAAGIFRLPSSLPAPLLFLGASALSTLLVVLRLLFGPGHGAPSGAMNRSIGLFLGLIGAVVALVGSVSGFKESGGELADLKDIDKIKGAFQQGGGSTPPPPPPPSMPPPPPPPPAG